MLSLNIGFSKKQQGNEPYSSIGASCNLSVEASDDLVKQPELLQKKMSFLFGEAKKAVDNQILNGTNGKTPAVTPGTNGTTPQTIPGNGGNNSNGAAASQKQLQFLVSLARKNGGIKKLQEYVKANLGLDDLKQLTKKQASALIEQEVSHGK